jgi:hypothetical protein
MNIASFSFLIGFLIFEKYIDLISAYLSMDHTVISVMFHLAFKSCDIKK